MRRIPLPSGDAGTRKTLGLMQQLAVDGSKDLAVREAAIAALNRAFAPAHNPAAALKAIFTFVRDRIRFVPDPVGVQAIQSPRATLAFRAGNCAQRATLFVALARSVGIPAELRFRVIAAHPRFPRSFSHVYPVARLGGAWVGFDPTYPNNPAGFEYPHPTRIGDFNL